MYDDNSRLRAPLALHRIYTLLVSFPIACFVETLLTDITYWQTAEMMWADFSAWLLTIGLFFGGLAAIAGLADFLVRRRIDQLKPAWLLLIGKFLVMVLSFVNVLVHSRDAWTSVVPTGLILSALVVLILLFIGWMGRSTVYRREVGVTS